MKDIIKKWWFWIVVTIILVALILIIIGKQNNNISLSDFKIESFSMNTDTSSYSTTYNGEGKIICSDTSTDYVVLMEIINITDDKTDYGSFIVHNGEGEFSTYDSSYTGTTQKPEYKFNIIGYNSFKNNK